jgi:HEPN domain-containing protein
VAVSTPSSGGPGGASSPGLVGASLLIWIATVWGAGRTSRGPGTFSEGFLQPMKRQFDPDTVSFLGVEVSCRSKAALSSTGVDIYARPYGVGPIEQNGAVIAPDGMRALSRHDISYLRAARELLDSGSMADVALPIAYLQRHALELALKGLLSASYEVAELRERLNANRTLPKATKQVQATHDLRALLDLLRQALTKIGFAVPQLVIEAVNALHEMEVRKLPNQQPEAMPDVWRYEKARRKKAEVCSIPAQLVLPLRKHQERLEAMYAECCFVPDSESSDAPSAGTLMGRLVAEYDALLRALYERRL